MARLDELDLDKSLSKKEEKKELKRVWTRLVQLRLTLGGLLGGGEVGPPLCVRSRTLRLALPLLARWLG